MLAMILDTESFLKPGTTMQTCHVDSNCSSTPVPLQLALAVRQQNSYNLRQCLPVLQSGSPNRQESKRWVKGKSSIQTDTQRAGKTPCGQPRCAGIDGDLFCGDSIDCEF